MVAVRKRSRDFLNFWQTDSRIEKRWETYNRISQLFGSLTKIRNISDEDLILSSSKLINIYKNYVSDNLLNKIVQFYEYVRDIEREVEYTLFLKIDGKQSPIRSFSKHSHKITLLFIKDKYRSTMGPTWWYP